MQETLMADDENHTGGNNIEAGEDAFAAVAAQARGEKKWYEIDCEELMSVKNAYMITATLSFVVLAAFGIATMIVVEECIVREPFGRCCECLKLNLTRVVGQSMERTTALNNIFYGLVMIANSGFGIWYVIVGVKSENKYQILCMMITQLLEVFRALFDTWFEKNVELQGRKPARMALAYLALALLILSTIFAMKLFRTFGWTVFRKGGVLKPVREAYKTYQVFRAFNRMDVQSSSLLFIVFGAYLSFVQAPKYSWIFWVILLCDMMASRWMVKYLKQEDTKGLYISMAAKSFVVIWWILITVEYQLCHGRFWRSLEATRPFFPEDFNSYRSGCDTPACYGYPSFKSIHDTYNGVACTPSNVAFDDRTLEMIYLNLGQALFFRIAQMVYGVFVARKFGLGLRKLFYKQTMLKQDDTSKRPEGGTAIKFESTRKLAGKKKNRNQSDLYSEHELQERSPGSADGDDGGGGAASSSGGGGRRGGTDEYSSYNDENDDEPEEDAMMNEHGASQREMHDDLAW